MRQTERITESSLQVVGKKWRGKGAKADSDDDDDSDGDGGGGGGDGLSELERRSMGEPQDKKVGVVRRKEVGLCRSGGAQSTSRASGRA